jgi:hypothetical protein
MEHSHLRHGRISNYESLWTTEHCLDLLLPAGCVNANVSPPRRRQRSPVVLWLLWNAVKGREVAIGAGFGPSGANEGSRWEGSTAGRDAPTGSSAEELPRPSGAHDEGAQRQSHAPCRSALTLRPPIEPCFSGTWRTGNAVRFQPCIARRSSGWSRVTRYGLCTRK